MFKKVLRAAGDGCIDCGTSPLGALPRPCLHPGHVYTINQHLSSTVRALMPATPVSTSRPHQLPAACPQVSGFPCAESLSSSPERGGRYANIRVHGRDVHTRGACVRVPVFKPHNCSSDLIWSARSILKAGVTCKLFKPYHPLRQPARWCAGFSHWYCEQVARVFNAKGDKTHF